MPRSSTGSSSGPARRRTSPSARTPSARTGRGCWSRERRSRPDRGWPCSSGPAYQQLELRFDGLQAVVAEAERGVVVADRQLEAHTRVDQGPEWPPEHRVEPAADVAVVADAPEEATSPYGDVWYIRAMRSATASACRPPLPLSPRATNDRRPGAVSPGLRGELDVRRAPGQHVLVGQQRPHRPTQCPCGRRRAHEPHARGQELAPIHPLPVPPSAPRMHPTPLGADSRSTSWRGGRSPAMRPTCRPVRRGR